MILRAVYDGGADPFEGTRELVLRGLPADARVIAARATVTPVDPSAGRDPFAEEIRFEGPAGVVDNWGATQVRAAGFSEIDFHARRTLAGLAGSDLGGARLLIDLGGSFVAVDPQGGLAPAEGPFLPLADDGPVPGIAASRVRISLPDHDPAVAAVRVRSLPTNVTLALADRPALFFHAGELAVARTAPDFSALLVGYLEDGAEAADGVVTLPFVLHSDAIARLRVEIEIEYLRTASLLPPGLPEAKLSYDLATVPRAGSVQLQVALPAAAVPVAAASRGKVVGPFAETRIAWPPAAQADAAVGTVALSPAQSAAQPLGLPDRPEGYEIVAIDLRLAAIDRRVELTIDLRVNDSGKPGADSLLAAPVPFELSRAADGGEAWLSVELSRPVTLRSASDRKAWLLLQSAAGEAAWSVGTASPGAVPLQASADGGFSYRAATLGGTAPLAALLRLRERPAAYRLPLSARLGRGAGAVRVDLSRLSPLGKVAFDLSIPEISAGISEALESALTTEDAPQRGELLADPAFARWEVTGDQIGVPRPFLLGVDANAEFVAFAPDGRIAYFVLAVSEVLRFIAWDIELDTEEWRLVLEVNAPHGLVVDPAGQVAYVLVDFHVAIIDLAARRLLGAPIATEGAFFSSIALAVSDDGLRIAIARGGDPSGVNSDRLAIYDVEQLFDLVRQGGDVEIAEVLLQSRDLEDEPVDLAFSVDSLLVLHASRLDRYDAATLAPMPSLALPGQDLAALAVEPGGRRALLVGKSGLLAVALDSAGMRRVLTLSGIGPRRDIAVSPQGDRAVTTPFVNQASHTPSGLPPLLIPIGTLRPLIWTATAGRARPEPLTVTADRGVALGEPASARLSTQPPSPLLGPSALSQVVPATSGHLFELSFFGRADGEARAELLWRSVSGETLGIVALPIELRRAGDPTFHRSRFLAPAETVAAEIRFVTEDGLALIRDASFRAPDNTLENSDLRGGSGTGWVQQPPVAPGFRVAAAADGSQVRNAGAAPVALRQEVVVEPATPFELRLRSRLENGPPPLIELRFLTADGTAVGAPVAIEIPVHGFDAALATGVVPATAARAEAVLSIPAGSSLRIEEIELRLEPRVHIPLTFLAEAPGELAVIGGAIAWDIEPASLRPGRSGVPLPAPTPPPGAVNEHEEECGCDDDVLPGSTLATGVASSPPPPLPMPPTPPPSEPPSQTPLEPSAIAGIGPRRAEILREFGIATLEALAAADPRELDRILPGVSSRMAVDFIRQVRELLPQR
jgi:Helix-hairpin-helix domain